MPASSLPPKTLTAALKQEALRLGFDLAGATAAAPPPGIDRFGQWLASGYAGRMRYLTDRADAYQHPRHVLDGVKSILMLATNYRTVEPIPAGPGQATVSRYSWGDDYHDLIHERLHRLADFHMRLVPGAAVRGVVDTAPLRERQFAQLAGLGWIGRNTLLLNKDFGSWLFLAALLTTEELQYDEPFDGNHCGSCRACLDACPTGALIEPYCLDARKCISYLTIELRGSIPADLRPPMGDRLFGCDICQEVCPWNHRTPTSVEGGFQPKSDMNPAEPAGLFALDEGALRQRFRRTPLWRRRRRGILRNAAIVLGNRPRQAALPALLQGLQDVDPVIRAACAWALGRYADPSAENALQERLAVEADHEVCGEIQRARPDGKASPDKAGGSGS